MSAFISSPDVPTRAVQALPLMMSETFAQSASALIPQKPVTDVLELILASALAVRDVGLSATLRMTVGCPLATARFSPSITLAAVM